MDFDLVAVSNACRLYREARGGRTEVNTRHAKPRFLGRKRKQNVFGLLALHKVGAATDALLLGARERRIPVVRVEVLDLLRAFVGHRDSLDSAVVIIEHFVYRNAAVIAFVRVRLAIVGRNNFQSVMSLRDTAVMIHHVGMPLEFGNAMVVVIAVDAPAVHARVAKNRALPGVRPHYVIRHAVVDGRRPLLPAGTVREVIIVSVLVDVRSLKHLAGREVVHLHVRTVTHRGILRIVQLDDIEVVGIRAAIAFATAPRDVGRAVVIDKDTRVKAPGNAIAADNAATADKLVLALAHGVCPRTIDARRLDVANTAATAIGEHDVERAVMDRDAGRPNSADTIHLARIVNDAVIGPVLHILAAETIKSKDLV